MRIQNDVIKIDVSIGILQMLVCRMLRILCPQENMENNARNTKIRLFNACIKSETWNAPQGDYKCFSRQHISADNSKGLLVQHDYKRNDMKIVWDIYFVIEIHKTIKIYVFFPTWTIAIFVKKFKCFFHVCENCSHTCLKWSQTVTIVY